MKHFFKIFFLSLAALVVLAVLVIFILWKVNRNKASKRTLSETINYLDKRLGKFALKNKTCLSVAIVIDDSVIYFNYTNGVVKTPVDSSSLYDVASVGKLFTGTMITELDKEKIISINDHIAPFFKDKLNSLKAIADITYKDLLTHTSGLPSIPKFLEDKFEKEWQPGDNPYAMIDTAAFYNYLNTCDNRKEKGEEEYSNLGYGLIGHSVALQTGSSYEYWVSEKVLKPAGMQDTRLFKTAEDVQNIVPGYDGNDSLAPMWYDKIFTAAGSYLSSAKDLAAFLKFTLNTYKGNTESETKNNMPLTWVVHEKDYNLYWHNGQSGGYRSYVGLIPNSNLGMVILSNKTTDNFIKNILGIDAIGANSLEDLYLSKKHTTPSTKKEIK